jgi:hypothetical protein
LRNRDDFPRGSPAQGNRRTGVARPRMARGVAGGPASTLPPRSGTKGDPSLALEPHAGPGPIDRA